VPNGPLPLTCLLAMLSLATPGIAADASAHWFVSVSDVSVSEESCAPHQAVFTVRLSKRVYNLPPRVVTVQYATDDGSAVGGVDYTPASGTLTFAPPNQVLTVSVPVTDALVPGPDKTFTLNLSNPSGAIIARPIGTATLHAPTVAKCAGCGLSCDDGNDCTADSCSASLGCRNVDVNACATAACALGGCALDTDGDGFSDAWEDNDYIDNNCNGELDAGDFQFPHRAEHVFSDVVKTGTGFGQLFPTVTDPTSPIGASTIVVTVDTGGTFGTAQFTFTADGGPPSTPVPILPVVDVAGNLRLLFYGGNFVEGDTYGFDTAMGPSVKVADKDRPNLYVEYDYMGDDVAGPACAADVDCIAGGATPNLVCHAGFCTHDHFPGDPLYRKVVRAFDDNGITLYIDPVHKAVPHSTVVSFSQAGDPDNGPLAICAGADLVAGDITNAAAVSYFDIKYRPGSDFATDPNRKNIFHYGVLGHFATCLTDATGVPGDCGQCPNDRATPPGRPTSGMSGTSELPGNDFMVTLGARHYVSNNERTPFDEQGVFMHELGHTLGLHHDGDNANHEYAPNYLSVMNLSYVFTGIQHAMNPGSTLAVDALQALDYSQDTLNTLDEPHLDEAAGTSPLASGLTGIVSFFDFFGGNGVGPESGAIDWDGAPAQGCTASADCLPGGSGCPASCPSFTGVCLASGFCEVQSDLNLLSGISETMPGYRDWSHTAGPSGAGGGPCVTSEDCRINAVRAFIHDTSDPTLDPHEPCLSGVCQSLWLASQCTKWAGADAPPALDPQQ
jgi:hypothetical protein